MSESQWWSVLASTALGDDSVMQVQRGEDGQFCLKVELDTTCYQIIPLTANQAACMIQAVNRIADGVTVIVDDSDDDTEDVEPPRQPFIESALAWLNEQGVTNTELVGDGWTGAGCIKEPPEYNQLAVSFRDGDLPAPAHGGWHVTVYVKHGDGRYTCTGDWWNNHPKKAEQEEEAEWDAITSKPQVRDALQRMADEADQQYVDGETEEM